MPTGFNPFAIPNIPGVPAVPLPKVDPNAGMTALLAVQNAIAKQQALAARAAGRGGGGGGGETNPRYTNYIDLPDGKGGIETVPVVGADKEGREARAKQLWNQRISQLASQDKDLAESLSKIGSMSVRGQKAELDKVRQQHLPRLFKQWNLSPDKQLDTVRLLTSDIDANIQLQQKAIDNTGVFQSLTDNAKMGWYSLRDAFKSIGKTPEERFVIDQQRGAERQAIIDSNPHLREEELRRREGNDSWTDFREKPVVNAAEAFGDMLASAGSIMAGQAGGAALAGALLRAIPTPVTQGAATAIQLGGAALGGAAVGAPLTGIELRDRLMSEMNAGNLTREQVIEGIENGETGAQIIGAITGGIPLGVAQTGLPLISRGANTMFGRRYIQNKATEAAGAKLAMDAGTQLARGISPEAAPAIGQNALRNAMAQQANKSFLRRYGEAIGPTMLDLGTLSALNTMGSNYAYGEATGQAVDITQGAGGAFLSGMAMGPVFGVLNARRPYVPAQVPVPETPVDLTALPAAPQTGRSLGGNGPTQGMAGATTGGGTRPQGPQNGPTGGNTRRQATGNPYEWGQYAGPQQQQTGWNNYHQQRQERQQQSYQQNTRQNANTAQQGGSSGGNPNYYTGNFYTADQARWDAHINNGGKRGFTADGQTLLGDVFKKTKNIQDRRVAVGKLLADGKITIDDVAAYIDSVNARYQNVKTKQNPSKDESVFNTILAEEISVYLDWAAAQANKRFNTNAGGGAPNNTSQTARPTGRPQNNGAASNPRPPRQNGVSQQPRNNKTNIQNAVQVIENAAPEAKAREVAEMLVNDLIHPDDMIRSIQQSRLVPTEKRRLIDAVQRFKNYINNQQRREAEDYARGRQEAIGTGGAGGASGTAPALGGNERAGQGSTDRTDTVGDSAAATNTQTVAADTAYEYLKRLAGGDNPLEGRGYAGISTQDTRTLAEIADFVGSPPLQLRGEQQVANRKSGGGQPAEQSAKPDTGQRSGQSAANPGTGSDGTSEPVGGNQSDIVKATPAQIKVGKKALKELDRLDNVKPDKDDRADLRQLVKDEYHGNKEELIDEYLSPFNISEDLANPDTDIYELRKNILTVRSAYKIKADPEVEKMFIEHLGTALDNPRYRDLVEDGRLDEAVDSYLTDRLYPPEDINRATTASQPTQSEQVSPQLDTPPITQGEQRSLFDTIQENSERQAADDAAAFAEIPQIVPEQSELNIDNTQQKRSAKKPLKKKPPKTEMEYAQNVGEIRNQLEKLTGEQLTEGGRKAAFDGYDYWEAIEEGVRIMEEKAAGKKLAPDEEHSYKMMKKYGIQDLNPVVTENAKAAAKQGQELDMKTTEKGQATITRRAARKKVNDPNNETCGLG